MNILFVNNDDKKKQLYELGFKIADKEATCVNLEDIDIKDKFKFKLNDNSLDAVECSNKCDLLTVSIKESLYIEGLDNDKQPGENYKIINFDGKNNDSKSTTPDEIAKYYSNIVKELGGNAKAKWIDNVTIAQNGKVLKQFKIENDAFLTSKISKNLDKKNPLNSLTLIPEFGDVHFSDCNNEEIKFLHEIRDQKSLEIIANAIKDIKNNK